MKPVIVKNNLNKVTISVFISLFLVLFLMLILAFNRFVLGNEKMSGEKLVEGNAFSLKDVKCSNDGDVSCFKNVKVSYNGANHDVKIMAIKENVGTNVFNLRYSVYIDEKPIEALDGGTYNANTFDLNFDGFVYVVDSKYLALVLPRVAGNNIGYGLTFYNNYNSMGFDFAVKIPGHKVCRDAGCNDVLNDLNDISFDGKTIKYWTQKCEGSQTVNLGITFNGVDAFEEIIDKFSGVHGTGSIC